jgi:hypothetical protein
MNDYLLIFAKNLFLTILTTQIFEFYSEPESILRSILFLHAKTILQIS